MKTRKKKGREFDSWTSSSSVHKKLPFLIYVLSVCVNKFFRERTIWTSWKYTLLMAKKWTEGNQQWCVFENIQKMPIILEMLIKIQQWNRLTEKSLRILCRYDLIHLDLMRYRGLFLVHNLRSRNLSMLLYKMPLPLFYFSFCTLCPRKNTFSTVPPTS